MDPPASLPNTQASRRPRARKSIAHLPSPEKTSDQENSSHDPLSISQDIKQIKPPGLSKKSRSKSFGPGGLDTLKDTSGNRRKSAALPAPKSILKPTIPLSPLREIPTRRGRASSADKPVSPVKSPRVIKNTRASSSGSVSPSQSRVRGGNEIKQSSQDEVSQDGRAAGAAAFTANTDAEAEERQKRKTEIQRQRDARRKSMANRRVSFAPDATLHTWDTEVLEDSTTSSASTESTRRMSAFSRSQDPTSNLPTTPAEQIEDPLVQRSPEPQRSAHQKKRRRSSGVPPMNFNNPEALSSSPYSGSSAIDEEDTVESFGDGETTISGSDHGDGTLGDATMQSIEDEASNANQEQVKNGEDPDASLHDAAERAGTRDMELDENGDVSMEITGDDVTAAFKPWVRQITGISSPHPAKAMLKPGEEKINPFSPAFRQATGTDGSPTPSVPDNEDMSMDMTSAVGGIINDHAGKNNVHRRGTATRRQSVAQRRRASGAVSDLGEGTMELTTALGGLQRLSHAKQNQSMPDENEDLSMEFTSVFGGVKPLSKVNRQLEEQSPPRSANWGSRRLPTSDPNIVEEDEEGDMEMTTSVGGIMPQQAAPVHRESNEVDGMDVMAASSSFTQRRSGVARPRVATAGSASGSPFALSPSRGSLPRYAKPTIASSTPSKMPQTPTHQVTPQPARPTTPGKTPPSANVSMRKTSPKKLFQQEIRASKSPFKSSPGVFRREDANGRQTPSIVFEPKPEAGRRISGIGIDKEGLGSPRMAAILDRRTSISDNSDVFAPKRLSRVIQFDDPRVIDAEVTKDQEDDQRYESKQSMMDEALGSAEGEMDATLNLKEMMQSMTPKKNKPKGRKSLAVGAARGVLGKRPAELDSDEEASPRTFGSASSPVKRVRLDNPPTFPEASGRFTRHSQATWSTMSGHARPGTSIDTTSPETKHASTHETERVPDSKIGLQDFLNLTNIRFMELTTTKRRPTVAHTSYRDPEDQRRRDPQETFVKAVIAGACTIPMLELYQHSCRELKKYISEGRNVVRSIEEESLEENPPMFSEYLSASPTARQVMDNQFKNMKTNARLLSKATWYEWRMKLLDGLKESLTETAKGLAQDDDIMSRREASLVPHLPAIISEQASLGREYSDLKSRADELATCNLEDLDAARERLQTVNAEIESRSRTIEANQEILEDLDEKIAAAREAKNAAQHEIEDAQKLREDCRGWSASEVKTLQTRVDNLNLNYGWSVIGAAETSLTLSFEKQLELSFNTQAFLPIANRDASTGLGLTFSGKEPESITDRFFIQYLRAQLHALPTSSTQASRLLRLVASAWRCARDVGRQVAYLQLRVGMAETRIVGDERMTANVELLLPGVKTKVKVAFGILVGTGAEESICGIVEVSASVVYGEGYREDRMSDFVKKRISGGIGRGARNGHGPEEAEGAWADAVVELRKGLVRRGAK